MEEQYASIMAKESISSPESVYVFNEKNQEEVQQFCQRVNQNLLNLKPNLRKKTIDVAILLSCGVGSEDLNPGVYRTLYHYLDANMGRLSMRFGPNGEVKDLKLGNIEMGSLYFKPMTSLEEQQRLEKHQMCYGILPTSEMPDRMLLTVDKKLIVGKQHKVSSESQKFDRCNAHIGDYYFNRSMILKENDQAELITFTPDVKEQDKIIQTIELYDKQGRKSLDVRINEFQVVNDNSYYLLSQKIDFAQTFPEDKNEINIISFNSK